jgi:hypothetical protein
MRQKRAAVLGCGPAGLFATHALIENGWSVSVYSKRRKSQMFGAQYLHAPIPGLTESESHTVSYTLNGTVDGYREKVYGVNPVMTSVEALEMHHEAWDIREAYDNAWNRYSLLVQDCNVTPEFLGVVRRDQKAVAVTPRVALDVGGFDIIINSIPMQSLCYQPDAHQFHATKIWALGDAPERGQYAPYQPPPFTIECDATRDRGWYRASNVYGYTTVEWPGRTRPPLSGVAEVVKPIYTDCTCYRGREMGFKFMPVGRYGQWAKGVLSHTAYTQAAQL